MSAPARTIQIFAVYLFVLAVGLLVAPNAVLGTLRLAPTSEVWIRVTGMLTVFLAIYYWTSAAAESIPFIRATVMIRLSVPVFLGLFVSAGWVEWPLLLVAGPDVAGALWTWSALRRG